MENNTYYLSTYQSSVIYGFEFQLYLLSHDYCYRLHKYFSQSLNNISHCEETLYKSISNMYICPTSLHISSTNQCTIDPWFDNSYLCHFSVSTSSYKIYAISQDEIMNNTPISPYTARYMNKLSKLSIKKTYSKRVIKQECHDMKQLNTYDTVVLDYLSIPTNMTSIFPSYLDDKTYTKLLCIIYTMESKHQDAIR